MTAIQQLTKWQDMQFKNNCELPQKLNAIKLSHDVYYVNIHDYLTT